MGAVHGQAGGDGGLSPHALPAAASGSGRCGPSRPAVPAAAHAALLPHRYTPQEERKRRAERKKARASATSSSYYPPAETESEEDEDDF